ncbi:MAG TPA: PHP-associated domain-containing protein [Patescibacteria group bacterium]|jgi:hypothetical protein|nr:PHP-associated domain-containing protein [Patescibacteria group bacterium]
MAQEFRLDLHTHSIISYDGGITLSQFRRIFSDGKISCAAITDHNEISFAQSLHSELGDKIIIGEEIKTKDGEIIGLFLTQRVEPNLTAEQTIEQIRSQNGLVYIPHPFEKTRSGISKTVLQRIASSIDIIEAFNARSREPWLASKTEEFARQHNVAQASSSDAHGLAGLGTALSLLSEMPTKQTLVALLRQAVLQKTRAPLWSLLDPTRNRIRRKLGL